MGVLELLVLTKWIIEPIIDKEGVFSCELNLNRVFEESAEF